ncbi:hypothetical protein OF363_02940, partial [Mycoplasma enhydrae]|uniref:hypothetical protein n=1 Tax=Mycoplasma enhydrae TaxID=2499220 RepID=UPI0021E6FA6E
DNKVKEKEAEDLASNKQKIIDAIQGLDDAISEVNEALKPANEHNLAKATDALNKIKNALEAANNTKNELEPKKDNFKAEFKELENKIKIAEQKQADILA